MNENKEESFLLTLVSCPEYTYSAQVPGFLARPSGIRTGWGIDKQSIAQDHSSLV